MVRSGCKFLVIDYRAILLVFLLMASPSNAYNDSLFERGYYRPAPWFAFSGANTPIVAGQANTLLADSNTPQSFSEDVILGIARNARNQACCYNLPACMHACCFLMMISHSELNDMQ